MDSPESPAPRNTPSWQRWLSGAVIFVAIAKAYRALRSAAEKVPGFDGYERLARSVTARVFAVFRLPQGMETRLEPLFEAGTGRRMDPPLVFALWIVAGCLGLYPSYLGHLDTTPYIFTVLPIVSGINPYLGLLTAVDFSVLDWVGKWLPFESVYGGNLADGLQNYLGARGGYVVAYSTVLLAGVLPGVLARAARNLVYRLLRGPMPKAGAAAGVVALLAAGAVWAWDQAGGMTVSVTLATGVVLMTRSAFSPGEGGISESLAQAMATVAGMFGGLAGALGSLEWARAIGNDFAFEHFRRDPDLSCKALSEANWIGRRGSTGLGGALGGAAPGGSGLAMTGGGPLAKLLSESAPTVMGISYVSLLEEPEPPPPPDGEERPESSGPKIIDLSEGWEPPPPPDGEERPESSGPKIIDLSEEPMPPPPPDGEERPPSSGPATVDLRTGLEPPPPPDGEESPPSSGPATVYPRKGLKPADGYQTRFGGQEALEVLEKKGLVRRTQDGWQAVGDFPNQAGTDTIHDGMSVGELTGAGWEWEDPDKRLIDPGRIAITVEVGPQQPPVPPPPPTEATPSPPEATPPSVPQPETSDAPPSLGEAGPEEPDAAKASAPDAATLDARRAIDLLAAGPTISDPVQLKAMKRVLELLEDGRSVYHKLQPRAQEIADEWLMVNAGIPEDVAHKMYEEVSAMGQEEWEAFIKGARSGLSE